MKRKMKIVKDNDTIESKLNVIADRLAGQAYNLPARWKASTIMPALPAIKFSVCIAKSAVHTKIRDGLFQHLQNKQSQQYLMEKEGWTRQTLDSIDWESVYRGTKSKSFGARLTRTKLQHNWIATFKYQHDKSYRDDAKCPCCNLHEETWSHVFRCKSQYSVDYREEQLEECNGAP